MHAYMVARQSSQLKVVYTNNTSQIPWQKLMIPCGMCLVYLQIFCNQIEIDVFSAQKQRSIVHISFT